MARGVNKVILLGNLGADPETRYTAGGSAVTNIRMATTDTWRDKQSGEQQERTEWHRIVFFGRLAEIAAEYLRKGSQCYVEGRIQTRKWQGAGRSGPVHHRDRRVRHAVARRPRRGRRRRRRSGPGAATKVQVPPGRPEGRRRHAARRVAQRALGRLRRRHPVLGWTKPTSPTVARLRD